MDLSVDVAGLSFKNPVLTASGTFGFGMEFSNFGNLETLGGVVAKGLSLKAREGNPMPRIAETPCGMLNAIGIQNPGVDSFMRNVLPTFPWKKTPLVANLYACAPEEFAELAAILADREEVAALEVNVSCPNVSQGGALFGADPNQIERVTRSVKQAAGAKPVWVKLSPNVTDVSVCAKAAEQGGADALSLINTLLGMAVDIHTRKPLLANVVGGLSGPAIKPVALRCVHQAVQAVSIPVVGIGGISCAQDVLEFILVGAHAVQVGTANFLRPDFAFRLVDDLAHLVYNMGITSWDSYRGTLEI
ncbi:dihydroorotate oxidase B, catalytic subunit [Paucidesulfovibrio gracilis DSM 16080]|uniref:Dihydroorotate dehydrogenase n=1 Tax=Paucidesulfovibrio gracilis DSM 16080 TaxID=1121449 RepID=A0A1T4WQT0_9BACT|nr:dihydroorotate dehydrogenase [Paucidesulfovibrio gracilis]SKA79703.1 dihydroorotate oxidase B, catalytic subunit [Paucidesulfovibrio gracilis DSM 16080]